MRKLKIPFSRTVKKVNKIGFKHTLLELITVICLILVSPLLLKRQFEYHILKKSSVKKVIRKVNGKKMYLYIQEKGIYHDLFIYDNFDGLYPPESPN